MDAVRVKITHIMLKTKITQDIFNFGGWSYQQLLVTLLSKMEPSLLGRKT